MFCLSTAFRAAELCLTRQDSAKLSLLANASLVNEIQ